MGLIQFKRGTLATLPAGSAGEPLFTTDAHRLYVGTAGGNKLVGVLVNPAGGAAPTVTDDESDGYSPGSVWVYSGTAYTCVDATAGAAVWTPGGAIELTGDVTAGPGTGSIAATIAAGAVTYAKIQDVSAASKLLGRGAGAGAGDVEEITLGTGLSMTGTTLSATATGGITELTGDVTAGPGSGSVAASIAMGAVTYAHLQNASANTVLGRPASAAGVVSEIALSLENLVGRGASGNVAAITLGAGLFFSGTVLSSTAECSQAEQEAATSTTRYVSPAKQQFHPSAAKGWVRFNGTGTVAVAASYNVSSITDNGTGDYTVNWGTDFSSGNYCIASMPTTDGATYTDVVCIDGSNPPAAGTTRVRVQNIGVGLRDDAIVCVAAFGDQ